MGEGTRRPVCPIHKANPKRAEAKKRRGYGLLSIPEKMSVVQWAQKHDPLFKIGGKERHKRLEGGN